MKRSTVRWRDTYEGDEGAEEQHVKDAPCHCNDTIACSLFFFAQGEHSRLLIRRGIEEVHENNGAKIPRAVGSRAR